MQRRILLALLAILLPFGSVAVKAGPALVIDNQTGLVLYAEDPDALWHPASLTKLMTAYVTFEALREGKIALTDKVVCSEHALSQPPSKIGLPVGSEMDVEMALKALIIQSANDVAVMLAEKIAGSEEAFVERMNATAKRLGMVNTRFFNANGLPNDQQVTTARDLAILARMLWKEYPQHAYLYSIPETPFGKRMLRTHNALLRTFEGADGMKTGFICAAGYNIVASATRDNRKIIAVVLGERSGGTRAVRAASLIQHGFDNYAWKAMFSTTLDQMRAEGTAATPAPNLQQTICTARRVYSKKQLRKMVKKKPGVKAEKSDKKEAAPAKKG